MIGQLWQVVDGDVRVAVEEAKWWGASLAVLVAAVHQPGTLATAQPETDSAQVARAVLADVAELYAAAAVAEAQVGRGEREDRSGATVRRDGADIVFAPGAELANLAMCIELFATAVLDQCSPDATVARGATAYAAAAWSYDIGKASGALEASGQGPQGSTGAKLRIVEPPDASGAPGGADVVSAEAPEIQMRRQRATTQQRGPALAEGGA